MSSSHTADQEKIVLKVLSYKSSDYYKVLEVEKSASDTEIKKSYRKLAIKLHPDKNPHPRSSEAFKIINKAFEVLGDPSKKKIYDQTGADPDSRFSGFANDNNNEEFQRNPFAGMNANGGMPRGFENDIFNMFFGNDLNGGAHTFTFGSNGFSFGGPAGGHPFFQQPRAHAHAHARRQQPEESSYFAMFKQMLPIFLFILVPIISNFFSSSNTVPSYSFESSRNYNIPRTTPHHNIKYFISKSAVDKYNDSQLKNFDLKIENMYIQDVRSKCSKEQIYKNDLIDDAHGWFFIDETKLSKAENMRMPNCERLRGMNLI